MSFENDYSYELIENESDGILSAEVIAREFTSHNPITVFDRITSNEFYDNVSFPLMKTMFNERLSFLVRHRSTGDIVGALIAGDLYRYHHENPFDPSSSPSNIAVSDLLDEMDDQFVQKDFGKDLKENFVLHLTVGAVAHEHRNRGLATKLSETLCQYAREQKGFEYALVQVTNPITQHIYVNKMNGKIVTNVDPTQWIWKKKDPIHLLKPYENYTGGSIPNILIDLRNN